MSLIFDELGLGPNPTFLEAKKAYYRKAHATHPDKYPVEERPKQEEIFKKLHRLWQLIDDQKKFDAYKQACSSGMEEKFLHDNHYGPSSQTTTSTSPSVNENNNLFKDADFYSEMIDIYVPVNFSTNAKNEPRITEMKANLAPFYNVILLPEIDENEKFENFQNRLKLNEFVKLINHLFDHHLVQVGATEKEAVDIVNQHSHVNPTLIVKLKVPLSYLCESKHSEGELSSALNAKSSQAFFVIQQHSKIDFENIISIRAMKLYDNPMDCEYKNTLRFGGGHPLNRRPTTSFWPADYCFLNNTKLIADQRPIAKAEQLVEDAKQELKRLESCYFARNKIAALQAAIQNGDTAEIQNALAIRRFGAVDTLFWRKGPTTAEKHVKTDNSKGLVVRQDN